MGYGGVGGRIEVVGDCSLCVSDLGGLGLSGMKALIECDGLKGEELMKIRAGWRWWSTCGFFGVGR